MKKEYIIIIVAVSVLLVAMIVGAFFWGQSLAPTVVKHDVEYVQADEPADEYIEEEDYTLEIRYLEEVIAPASDLVTTRFYYKDADTYESYKEFKGFKIPLTTDQVVFTYEGTVSLGFDFSAITYRIDEANKKIYIKLPAVKIIANEIEFDSFTYYEVKNSIFTEQTMEITTDIMAVLQEKTEQRVMNDQELLDSVRDNAENLIRGLLKAAEHTSEYKVEFEN